MTRLALATALSALVVAGCGAKATGPAARACPAQPGGEVQIAGGEVILGAAGLHPEEGPPRAVAVGPFSIDRTEVTNDQFAEFVAATGYVTMAERAPDPDLYPGVPPEALKPSSLVFVGADAKADGDPAHWWRVVDGANWRHPEGPDSSIRGLGRHPVVHIGYEDALAYARWRGRDLPTEAEWELAARGGLQGKTYEWGDTPPVPDAPRANTWQGVFPAVDTADDGYRAQTAPVGCFAPNGLGLSDMSGNVWEWTRDWYLPGHEHGDTGPDADLAIDPADGTPKHVIKGGSFLCSDDFCLRYRPAARQAGPPDTGSSHIGVRTVRRGQEAGSPPSG